MLGVGEKSLLPADPEAAALRALELLKTCIPWDPNVITGRKRYMSVIEAAAAAAAAAPTPPVQTTMDLRDPPKDDGRPPLAQRVGAYLEQLATMIDDLGEPAVYGMVTTAKLMKRERP